MTNINKSIFSGNVSRDAEITRIGNGTAICKFSVANNVYGGKDNADYVSFFDCVLWGKRGESLGPYLKKGTTVFIEAQARQERWEKDGVKRSKISFTVTDIQMNSRGNTEQKQPVKQNNEPNDDPFQDDIPF